MAAQEANKPRLWSRATAALALVAVAAILRPQSSVADTQTSAWTTPTAIVTQLNHAALPSLAYTDDGTAHGIWESNRVLYYASQTPGKPWSAPVRVAAGMAPSMIADDNGDVHAVFANQFMGNYEIYYVRRHNNRWSLPVNVSQTSGYSGYPVLAQANNKVLHAAWMDNTPGYWTIYYGTLDASRNSSFWTSLPVPYARGQVPSIAASPSGSIFLAWQDRVPGDQTPSGTFDAFLTELTDNTWTLPVNVSDSPDVESLGVSITATWDGVVHMTWVDQDQQVRYGYGRGWYWSVPQTVWTTDTVARGPSIMAEYGSILHIGWDQGETIWATRAPARPPSWPEPSLVASPIGVLQDLTLALMPSGGIAMGWVQASGPEDVSVYQSWRATTLARRVWLPLLTR